MTTQGGAVSDVAQRISSSEPTTSSEPQMATLTYPGGTAEFPILESVDGPSSIDISALTRKTGLR